MNLPAQPTQLSNQLEGITFKNEDIFPPLPPDYIFKYRQNRTAPSISVAQKYVTYLYDKVDYIDGEGIFYYYKGIGLPRKGFPFSQAVYSINSTKRLLARFMMFFASKKLIFPLIGFSLVPKRWKIELLEQVLLAISDVADMAMFPYYLADGYYCKTAKEIRKFTKEFLLSLGVSEPIAEKTSEIAAMIMEFDDAYRYRFQDLMTETSMERILADFPAEIKRLVKLDEEREAIGKDATGYNPFAKLNKFAKIAKIVWWIPSIRRAIQKALNVVEFSNWQLDKADIYHNYLYGDYNVQGKSVEERQKEYFALYGNDMKNMPPRVEIVVNQ